MYFSSLFVRSRSAKSDDVPMRRSVGPGVDLGVDLLVGLRERRDRLLAMLALDV
jgi:hypothetical protein